MIGSENCDSFGTTRNTIAKRSVWPTSPNWSVDAWNFPCQVWTARPLFLNEVLSYKNSSFCQKKFLVNNIIFAGDENTKICGAAKVQCYDDAEINLFDEKVARTEHDKSVWSFRQKCNCMPACLSIDYDAEINNVKYDMEIFESSLGLTNIRWGAS